MRSELCARCTPGIGFTICCDSSVLEVYNLLTLKVLKTASIVYMICSMDNTTHTYKKRKRSERKWTEVNAVFCCLRRRQKWVTEERLDCSSRKRGGGSKQPYTGAVLLISFPHSTDVLALPDTRVLPFFYVAPLFVIALLDRVRTVYVCVSVLLPSSDSQVNNDNNNGRAFLFSYFFFPTQFWQQKSRKCNFIRWCGDVQKCEKSTTKKIRFP